MDARGVGRDGACGAGGAGAGCGRPGGAQTPELSGRAGARRERRGPALRRTERGGAWWGVVQARTGTAPQKTEMGLAGLWPGAGTQRRTGEACPVRCHSERERDHGGGNGASLGRRTARGRDHGGGWDLVGPSVRGRGGERDHGRRGVPHELSLREGAGPRWERRVLWASFPMRGGASLGCRELRGWDLVEPLKKKNWYPGSCRRPALVE